MGTEDSQGQWHCAACGEMHDGEAPFHYNSPAPFLFYTIPEEERDTRITISPDLCMIDDEHFFLKGNLVLPVSDHDDDFSWDVWVELNANHFRHVLDLWEFEGRAQEPPYPATIATQVPLYEGTLSLNVEVQTREVGVKPTLTLAESDHPLSVEQRNGITLERVRQIASHLHQIQIEAENETNSEEPPESE